MYTEEEKRIINNIIEDINSNPNIKPKTPEQIQKSIEIDNKTLILNIIEKQMSNMGYRKDLKYFEEGNERISKIIKKCVQSQELSEAIFNKINYLTITKVNYPEEFKEKFDWTKYTIRHYTSIDPKQFNGIIKSNLALTVEKELLGIPHNLNTSGHTTQSDWNIIGNIGDTFYCLYYKDEPATGYIPTFLKNPNKQYNYYIEWSAKDFGNCWASSDYLSFTQKLMTAIFARKPFFISSYSGNIKDVIIASILKEPKAITQWLARLDEPKKHLADYSNFEIKKHGSMTFNSYYAKNGDKWELKTL